MVTAVTPPLTDQEILKRAADESAWKTQEEKDAKEKAAKVRLILSHIKSSKKEADPWLGEVRSAWREFQSENSDGKYRIQKFWQWNTYNRYWADTMTILPTLYCNTPKTVARRRFDKDPIAKTGSILIERLATFLIDSQPFNRTQTATALEFLNASRATGRIYYCHDIVTQKERIYVQEMMPEPEPQMDPAMMEEGQEPLPPMPMEPYYVDDAGNEAPLDAVIMQDEAGALYYETDKEEEIVNPRVFFKALHFDQMLISTGARDLSDIWFIAYQVTITRKQAYELFGDVINKIDSSVADQRDIELDIGDETIKTSKDLFTYWEYWDKSTKRIYFIHENYTEDFLKEEDDIYGLVNFFPSPDPLMTNERYDNCYPTPDYTMTRDVYEQLHILAKRINRVTKAIKGVLVYDGSIEALDALFSDITDNEGVAVANFKDLMGQGGLDALVQLPPYERLAMVLDKLMQAFERQEIILDKLRGISDIIRGTSDPVTSATAEKIKKQMATNRQSIRQKEMVRFVRDTIEMMCDLALKVFPDDYIKKIVGFTHLDPADQERFDQALEMLRDDQARLVRIDIETDSITAIDDEEDKQAANEMMTAVSGYVAQTVAAIEQNPTVAPIMFKLLEIALNSFKFGKHAQDELNELFGSVMEKIQNPEPPAPPPPDPKLLEIESRERIAMAELQFKSQEFQATIEKDYAEYQSKISTEQNKLQIEIAKLNQAMAESQQKAADKQQELQVKIMDIQSRATNDQSKIQSDAYYWEQENLIEAERNQITLKHNENMALLEASKAELTRQVEETNQALETLKLQLEKQRDDKIAMEKMIEERRLERQDLQEHMKQMMTLQAETKAEVMVAAMQNQQAQKAQTPSAPPAINITMPKRGKKVGKISTDKNGNPTVEIEEIEDDFED